MSSRNEQSLLVQDLEPNTKYEFAIRLHLDQLPSPWSPVVYQTTFPEGRIKYQYRYQPQKSIAL